MKNKNIVAMAMICSLIFTSCEGKGVEKFLGKWKSLGRGIVGNVTIRKHGDVIETVPDNNPNQHPMIFIYDKERDMLVSKEEGLEISYVPKNKHLKLGPTEGQRGMSLEMEKPE